MTDPTEIQDVPQELAGYRLDRALSLMFPQYSRSRLKNWILSGDVTVDGEVLRPRDPVVGGERVAVSAKTPAAAELLPEPVEFSVVHEDDEVLVVDKPAGLVVHPGAGNASGTLVNGLLHRYADLATLPRAGIIHRLDKDTSGLLVVARTLPAHTSLVRQLAEHRIVRKYAAVCCGVLTGGGTIDAPIARHPVDRLRMSVQDRGKPAVTHYRVRQRFAAHTYIGVQLETGRTHQIRVHFAYKRHPLVGDQTYGGRLAIPAGTGAKLEQVLRSFRRQALHAEELRFAHPVSAAPIKVTAEIPQDLRALLDALASGAEQQS